VMRTLAPIPLCRPVAPPRPLGGMACNAEFRRILDLFH